jgi:hypothetical protein
MEKDMNKFGFSVRQAFCAASAGFWGGLSFAGLAGPRGREDSFDSGISVSLFFVTDFLKQTGSPLLAAWEKRAEAHRDVDNDESFTSFLNDIHRTYVSGAEPGQRGPGVAPP